MNYFELISVYLMTISALKAAKIQAVFFFAENSFFVYNRE